MLISQKQCYIKVGIMINMFLLNFDDNAYCLMFLLWSFKDYYYFFFVINAT